MVRGMKRTVTSDNDIVFNASIHNRFDVEVVDSKTGKIKQRARGYNVICDQLWSKLLTSSFGSYFSYIAYGDGTGTPSAADTSLFSHIGLVSATQDGMGLDMKTGVFHIRKKIQLSETTAVGKVISEVGICSSNSTSALCTHAMLCDMNGNHISLEKTDVDIVNIYATVYVHFNPAGYNGVSILPIYSTGRGILYWMAGCGGSIYGAKFYGTPNIAWNDSDIVSLSSVNCSVANKTVTMKVGRLAAGDGNIGGIMAIALVMRYDADTSTAQRWSYPPQIGMVVGGNWYEGTNVIGESVATGDGNTVDYALDFPYAIDATVYVDGVVCEDVVVKHVPNTTLAFDIVRWIDPDGSTVDLLAPAQPPQSSTYWGSTNPKCCYNPLYELGITSVSFGYITCYVSDDLVNWFEIGSNTGGSKAYVVPEAYKHYRFWKFVPNGTSHYGSMSMTFDGITTKAIHFNAPPAVGAVITADYFTKCIAKDANHVFDLTVTIQLGEYNEG